jgi:hypothetical protein
MLRWLAAAALFGGPILVLTQFMSPIAAGICAYFIVGIPVVLLTGDVD